MKQKAFTQCKLLLFYLILPLVLVNCVPTESAPDNAAVNEVSADIVTVKARPDDLTVEASPTATFTNTPTVVAIPIATAMPTVTTRPTAVNTPIPAPIVTPPSPTAIVPFETPENALTCHKGDEFTKCYDVVLGVEFEYPNQWGNLTGNLRQAMSKESDEGEWLPSGYAYDYQFDEFDEMYIISGGRSREFSEPRGGILTDFSGFPACSWPYYRPNEICNEIKPNVVLLISLLNATEYCQHDYGWRPIEAFAVVALEIPDNDLINGFIFGMNILGADIIEQVERSLPRQEGQSEIVCDDATRQEFDRQMAQIAEDIANMTITGETARNLEFMNHLAKSIVFK